MAAEPDEYQVAELLAGFPVCTFRPKAYTRVITSIVVTNGATGDVACYRGTLNSIAVARNTKGDSNTLGGGVRLPAGQLFFVRWANAGSPVSTATARVSFKRVDANFDEGDNAVWSEESVGRIVVPSDGETDPSQPPYIIIANDSDQAGNDFASLIFRTPTLPPTWEYRLQIRKGVPPFDAQFEMVLWDTATDDKVSRLVTQNYNDAIDRIVTVLGPSSDDPTHTQQTYVWGHKYVEIATQDALLHDGSMVLRSHNIFLDGELDPIPGSDLNSVEFGKFNAGAPPFLRLGDRTLGFSVAGIHMLNPPAPAGLVSAVPITITGASTTTYVKRSNATRTRVHMSGGGYITAGAGASVVFGILVSGGVGDFSVVKGSFSSLSNRLQFSGSILLPLFPAGTYTITPRWFRSAGASTVVMDATDASLTVSLKEEMQA